MLRKTRSWWPRGSPNLWTLSTLRLSACEANFISHKLKLWFKLHHFEVQSLSIHHHAHALLILLLLTPTHPLSSPPYPPTPRHPCQKPFEMKPQRWCWDQMLEIKAAHCQADSCSIQWVLFKETEEQDWFDWLLLSLCPRAASGMFTQDGK